MKSKISVRVILFLSILFLVAIEALIQIRQNIKSSDETSLFLLDQVISIVDKNDTAEMELMDSIKEDYVVRAKAVAYIFENNPGIESNIDELKKIANLTMVDEINIINEDGVIIGGTISGYYGMTLDDGIQISFFKPMLEDKTLSLCQDILPNTAERKYMMYAAVWKEDGKEIVQVGIEPKRIIAAMGNNSIDAVIDTMPMMDGIDVYVATSKTGLVVAATQRETIGKHLPELGLKLSEKEKKFGKIHFEIMDHNLVRCCFKNYQRYDIGISYKIWSGNKNIIISTLIVMLYLIFAAVLFDRIWGSRDEAKRNAESEFTRLNAERNRQFEILASMSQIYYTLHLIDLENNTVVEYSSKPDVKEFVNRENDAILQMRTVMEHRSAPEFKDLLLKFTDLTTVSQRMHGKKTISFDFMNVEGLWMRCSFIVITKNEQEIPTSVIFTTQVIDDEKRREENLLFISNTDELTGFYNRRAYEDDLSKYEQNGIPDNFALISMDINGLKTVNDTLGHAAGDELITGSCQCIKDAFGNLGKLYRTGGDEFFAILEADAGKIDLQVEKFNTAIRCWSGKYINSISVSCGVVTRKEFPEDTISNMELTADKRMYKAKALYYSARGVDRRSRQAAYTVICDTYERILKINLTADTYQTIIGKEIDELDTNPPAKISEYFSSFAYNGGIHQDDLEEFIKKTKLSTIEKFFKKNHGLNIAYAFTYKRRIGRQYKKAIMEIVASKDYSEDNQELFLYVKAIEK